MRALEVDGTEVSDEAGIRQAVTDFYRDLYNMDQTNLGVDENFFNEMFTVEPADNTNINAPVTLEELWKTLKPTKATTPGPDGLSNLYLKKLWG
jgi:hypothetical protein